MANPNQLRKYQPWQLRLGERRALLLIGDLLMAVLALAIALLDWGRSVRFIEFNWQFLQERVPLWFYILPFIWLVLLVELYDVHAASDKARTLRGILVAAAIGLGAYLLYFFVNTNPAAQPLPRRSIGVFLLAVAALTLIWRWLYIRLFTAPQFMRRVLLVGGGRSGELLLSSIKHLSPAPFHLAGIVDDDPQKEGLEIEGVRVLGGSERLAEFIGMHNVSDLIVCITGEMGGCMFQSLLDAQECGVEIVRMPVAYEELLGRVPIRVLETNWILRAFVDEARVSAFYDIGKRLVDIAGGLVGALGVLVVLPFVGLAILIDDGFPIFYGQTRSGKAGVPYTILKFRTMKRDAEADGKPKWAKEDDERATRTGKFLRRTHLDELPQFLNVLRGDMSLVGPRAERPELVEMFQRHVPFYRARLLVKPGISGWAQVNYGYAATIDETITKLEYDLYYIKHRSALTDLLVLLRTPATMLGLRGR